MTTTQTPQPPMALQPGAVALRTPRVTGRRIIAWLLGGLFLAAVVAAVCSLVGQISLTWPYWTDQVWLNRVGRLAAAATVGLGLAVSGMALQGLLRNPLAEPYILGISSGAGVGVGLGPLVATAIGAGAWLTVPTLAVAGAMTTCLVVYGIAQRRGRLDPYVLLLSGVIVNVFNGALMLVILLLSDRNRVIDFVSWGMGHIPEGALVLGGGSGSLPSLLVLSTGVVIAGWFMLLIRSSAFNALGLGDTVARSSGVPVNYLRVETFIVVGIMTSACVALAGPIGFVGLIVPHICRLVVGPDHRLLVVVSAVAGAMFLMLADTICRMAGPALGMGALPVGVLTALSGGPFFIALLRRRTSKVQL